MKKQLIYTSTKASWTIDPEDVVGVATSNAAFVVNRHNAEELGVSFDTVSKETKDFTIPSIILYCFKVHTNYGTSFDSDYLYKSNEEAFNAGLEFINKC